MELRYGRIGDICRLVKGTYPTLKTLPGDYPLVVTAAERRTADSYELEGPAVCVPLISSTGHGHASIHRVHYQEGKFALANLLVALLPKDETLLDAKYLFHLLMAKKDEYFVPLMSGTANVSLKDYQIADVEVPLPPLSEQRRIVARIEHLTAKIDHARSLRHFSQQAVYVLVGQVRDQLFQGLARAKTSISLESVADVRLGKMLSQASKTGINSAPYLRNANIQRDRLDLSTVNEMDFDDYERTKFALKAGDILVCEGGDIGKAAIWNNEIPNCYYQKALHRVRVDADTILPRFLLHHFFWAVDSGHFADIKTQTTIAHLTGVKLKSYKVYIPPIHEQLFLVTFLDNLQYKVDSLKGLQAQSSAELDALLLSIVDRAFKGEL